MAVEGSTSSNDPFSEMRKSRLFEEILTTEKTYLEGLRFFATQMEKIRQSDSMPKKDIKGKKSIQEMQDFTNIVTQLITYHERLQNALANNTPEVWEEHLSQLKSLYEEQAVTLSEAPFPEHVQKFFAANEGQSPESYLITLTQRPMRYVSLFTDLQKNAPPDSLHNVIEESKNLSSAMAASRLTKDVQDENSKLQQVVLAYTKKSNSRNFEAVVNFLQHSEQLVSVSDFKQAFQKMNFNQLSPKETNAIQTALDEKINLLQRKIEASEVGISFYNEGSSSWETAKQDLQKAQAKIAKRQELKQFLVKKSLYDKMIDEFPIQTKSAVREVRPRELVAQEILQQLRHQRDAPQGTNISDAEFSTIKKEAYLKAIKDAHALAVKGGAGRQFDEVMQEIKDSPSLLKKIGIEKIELENAWVPQSVATPKATPSDLEQDILIHQTPVPLVHGFQRSLPIPTSNLDSAAKMLNSELVSLKQYLDVPENRQQHKMDAKRPYTDTKLGANKPHDAIVLNFEDQRKAYAHQEEGGVVFSIPKNQNDADFNDTFTKICKLAVHAAKPGTVFDLSVAPKEKQEALETIFKQTITESKREGDLSIKSKGPQQKM